MYFICYIIYLTFSLSTANFDENPEKKDKVLNKEYECGNKYDYLICAKKCRDQGEQHSLYGGVCLSSFSLTPNTKPHCYCIKNLHSPYLRYGNIETKNAEQ